MKTILYMSLFASGQIARPDEKHPIPKEILGDFVQHVRKAGNVVVGRRTYDLRAVRRLKEHSQGLRLS